METQCVLGKKWIQIEMWNSSGRTPQQRYQYKYHKYICNEINREKANPRGDEPQKDWAHCAQYKTCTQELQNEGWLPESVGLLWWYS